MEFKGKEETHVTFAKGFKTFLVELQKYVKNFHTTGLAWNPRGGLSVCNRACNCPCPHAGAGTAAAGGGNCDRIRRQRRSCVPTLAGGSTCATARAPQPS